MTAHPAHLKAFRSHFALTQRQAAHLLDTTKTTWWRWEQNYEPVPKNMLARLQRQADMLTKRLKYRAKFCHTCGKVVEKWLARGEKRCPYCDHLLYRPMKTRILAVLPKIKLKGE